MRELSVDETSLAEALVALRDLREAYDIALWRIDDLFERADPGLIPDVVADFDERSIAMECLGTIRRGIDDLVRLLAATKGRHALGELVERFEAARKAAKVD